MLLKLEAGVVQRVLQAIIAANALTLLVGRQEEHPSGKIRTPR